MGMFPDPFDMVSSPDAAADSVAGYAGPVPGKGSGAPGKSTLTGKLPPRGGKNSKDLGKLKSDSQDFIVNGPACSQDPDLSGCLWDDSAESDAMRGRVRELITLNMPYLLDDMHAGIERPLLDTKLAAPPKSVVIALIGGLIDLVGATFIAKLSSTLKTLGTAAEVARGISEVTGQTTPMLVNMVGKLPVKQLETVAKTVVTTVKKKIEEKVKGLADTGFQAGKAAGIDFLKGLQNGFGQIVREFITIFTKGTDAEQVALLAMLENRPSLEEFEEKFRDLLARYSAEGIAHIGKRDGLSEAMYKVVCVSAYGKKIYLNVITASGPRVGARPRMVGAGGQNRDIEDPDRPASLVAIISPDLIDTAIANSGGHVEEVPMTWEGYRDGESPVHTLDMLDGAKWPPSIQGRFRSWLLGAYQESHGGNAPPDDAFSWSDPNGIDAHSAVPASAPVSPGQPVGDDAGKAMDSVSSAFDFASL